MRHFTVADVGTASSLTAMFFEQASNMADEPFLWARRDGVFVSRSWSQVAADVCALAAGLAHMGVEPGDRVMLVAENRPEWIVADLAIMAMGAISVPAYTTNTAALHLHVMNDSGSRAVIVSNATLARPVLEAARDASTAPLVVMMEDAESLIDATVQTESWDDLLEYGRNADKPATVDKAGREDLCCLIYTSGTGGAPRGVMLSHGAILHNCAGALHVLEGLGDFEKESFLSFLPLSHAYEHLGGVFLPMSLGADVYFAERVENLVTYLPEARPTILTAVPRLYETMRGRILQNIRRAGAVQKWLFNMAVKLGEKRYRNGRILNPVELLLDAVCERTVRAKVRARFGGQVKAIVSGGAPLNQEVGLFFTALGMRLLQGYGQTEAAPLISVNIPSKIKLHAVGPPVKGVELKIAEDGEIVVRGEMVMQGYWNDPDSTAQTIRDGWLHTGDVGHLDEDGFLVITDRKKDLIVNSGGDNIAPQRVEGILCLDARLAQAMVYGDKRPHLSAVLVPDPDFVAEFTKDHGLSKPSFEELAKNTEFRAEMERTLKAANDQLSPIERVRRFIIASEAFSVENGQMTPTMKARRHVITQRYQKQLEGLYKS